MTESSSRPREAPAKAEGGRQRVRVLSELRALLDSFPPQVRARLMAHIHSVLVGLTP